MSIQDIVILSLVGIFAVWGLWRGIIREAFDAAGLILGVLAARHFAPPIGAVLPPKAVPQIAKTIIVSIVILLVVWLVVAIVGFIVRKIIRHGPVKSVDRVGGFMVGTLKGILIVLALAILISITPFGILLDVGAGKAPVYSITMKIARPLGERYRKALKNTLSGSLAAEINKNVKKAGKAKVKLPSKSNLKTAALSSDPLSNLSSIQIKLDTLSPESKQQIKDLLNKFGSDKIDLGPVFDLAAKSGTVIDISLDDLSDEGKTMLKSVIKDGSIDEKAIQEAIKDSEVDVTKMVEQLGLEGGK